MDSAVSFNELTLFIAEVMPQITGNSQNFWSDTEHKLWRNWLQYFAALFWSLWNPWSPHGILNLHNAHCPMVDVFTKELTWVIVLIGFYHTPIPQDAQLIKIKQTHSSNKCIILKKLEHQWQCVAHRRTYGKSLTQHVKKTNITPHLVHWHLHPYPKESWYHLPAPSLLQTPEHSSHAATFGNEHILRTM